VQLNERLKIVADSFAEALNYGPELTGSIEVRFFELGGLLVERGGVSDCSEGGKADACVLVNYVDFEAICLGKLDALSAIMTGRVKMTGRIGAIIQFARKIRAANDAGAIGVGMS
jgi:putative sterol carrier protein